MQRTPLLLVGDGPTEPSGLGRILRDLGVQLAESDLPIDLASVGESTGEAWDRWPHIHMGEHERAGDWGARCVAEVYRRRWGATPGILWVIWDPGRLAAYQGIDLPVQLWSYPAIDAPNRNGAIGGPAGEALQRADRVIAYGRWASGVVKATRGGTVPYLPHGLTAISPADGADGWAREQFGPHCRPGHRVIGCVATNQPRKDLGLYFATLAELRARGHKVYGWLHTDTLVKAWSVPQLVEDCGLAKRVTVSLEQFADWQLAALYAACSVTIAPGLGEGFGYPIIESLAQGVPVVHGDVAGGRELVPRREWRFPVRAERLEGIYGQVRPVYHAVDVANAIERVWDWQAAIGERAARAYCRGSVAHLEWRALWPRWRGWVRQGLEG